MTHRQQLDNILADLDHARRVAEDESQAEAEAIAKVQHHKEAQALVQLIAQAVEQAVHSKIASAVSSCLDSVFDDPYEFLLKFDRKRNRTEARPVFERNGLELDPMTAAGGGAVDVAAFALRISCLVLKRHQRQVVILDEPFRFVSKEYRPRIRHLLEQLAEDLGVQFIIVTHIAELATGHVVEIDR